METFPIPIYFAFESKELTEAYELLKEANKEEKEYKDKCNIQETLALISRIMTNIMAEDYQVTVNINEPISLKTLNFENYYVLFQPVK